MKNEKAKHLKVKASNITTHLRIQTTIVAAIALAGLLASSCADDQSQDQVELVVPTVTTDIYYTADQMLLANEINESGEPFAEALGYDLDKLDPMAPGQPDDTAYVLGIENYEYSRYQLGTVISRSGIGLHMMWAPMISRMAAMQPEDFDGSMTGEPNGVKEDDMLMQNIMTFSVQSGHNPPGNPWPEFAEFVSADPHLNQAIDADHFLWEDFSSLRWDRSKMDKVLNPGAMGQALMKQYLWSQDMLSAFHDGQDNGIEADGSVSPDLPDSPEFDPDNDVYLGGDALDGFIGQVLTAEAINKIALITGMLAYDGSGLGALDLASYDPSEGIQYFPHAIGVTESQVHEGLPPMATAFEVTDAGSWLFDQASLLWGTTSFTNMMNPSIDSDSAHLAYHEVFDGSPFPASMSQTGMPGPYDLMKGTSKAIFQNLVAMHYDADNQVFVDQATLEAGLPVHQNQVSTTGSAYLIVALETFIGEFANTPLEQRARQAVSEQAQFLIDNLSDNQGLYFEQYDLSSAKTIGKRTAEAQAAAVRGLFVAARITQDATFAQAAKSAYDALLDNYYVMDQKLFRSTLDSNKVVYTPKNFAILAGALREASLQGGDQMAAGIYVDFFMRVAENMQLSEGPNTGETGGDSDGDGIPFIPEQPDHLPPVFASQATYQLNP